jgi:glycosyltransferase involved in cell wall biosynthesis
MPDRRNPDGLSTPSVARREADRPDVSVVIACHNAADTVGETLDSLLGQTFQNWEAVCVDDGSTDGTAEILQRFAACDSRFHVVRLAHAGQPAAKNAGLRQGHAPLAMILDADDVAYPDALETLVRVSTVAGHRAVVAPGYEFLTANGRPLGVRRYPEVPEFTVDALLPGNRLSPMALVPTAVLGPDPFDETLPRCIDWNVWLRLAREGAACITVPRSLFGYRLHRASLSHNADRMIECVRRVLDRWTPHARRPERLSDVPARLACRYGAIAMASGDEEAVWRYVAALPGAEIVSADEAPALAAGICGSLQFVRGAMGETWRHHRDEWLYCVEPWLREGPWSNAADDILDALRAIPRDLHADLDLAPLDTLLRRRPECRRLVIYGLGRNGARLLDQLRRDSRWKGFEFLTADDFADETIFAIHGLPRDDPRGWSSWPRNTLALVTPNDNRALCRVLASAGGRENRDFLVLGPSRWTASVPHREGCGVR